MPRTATCVGLVVAVLLVGGCSGEADTATSAADAGAQEPATPAEKPDELSSGSPSSVDPSVEEPTEALGSPQQLRPYGREGDELLWNVREELTRRCMEEAGFGYVVNPRPPTAAPDPIPRLSVERAQTEGYRQILSETNDLEPPVLSPDASLPGYVEALDPADDNDVGCFERSYQQIFGDDYGNTAVDLFRALPGMDLTATVEASADFAALIADWSACMQAGGFGYENPGAAVFSFVGPAAGDMSVPPTPEEIRVAVADATCRDETGFEARYESLHAAEYEAWLSANETALQAVIEQTDRDLQRIREAATSLGLG